MSQSQLCWPWVISIRLMKRKHPLPEKRGIFMPTKLMYDVIIFFSRRFRPLASKAMKLMKYWSPNGAVLCSYFKLSRLLEIPK